MRLPSTDWRNGSASDSSPEGYAFESRIGHYRKLEVAISGTPTGTSDGPPPPRRRRRDRLHNNSFPRHENTLAPLNKTAPLRPKGSGYVEKDEDSTLDRFRDWPDQYVPDETYEGTCVPGTASDNAPLEDLSLVARTSRPHAFFEAPFHARLPANHPAMLSPWERLEKAGRFVDDDEDEKVNKPRKKKQQKKTTKVEAVDDIEPVPVKEEKDPLFADDASDLLDAALGLDDDEDERRRRRNRRRLLRRRRAGDGRAAGLRLCLCVRRVFRSVA